MKKIYQKTCILSGMVACAFYLLKIKNTGMAIQLGDLIVILFSGSLLPTGILFILSAFWEELSQEVIENKIGLVASGITIIYVALVSLGIVL